MLDCDTCTLVRGAVLTARSFSHAFSNSAVLSASSAAVAAVLTALVPTPQSPQRALQPLCIHLIHRIIRRCYQSTNSAHRGVTQPPNCAASAVSSDCCGGHCTADRLVDHRQALFIIYVRPLCALDNSCHRTLSGRLPRYLQATCPHLHCTVSVPVNTKSSEHRQINPK